MFAPRKCSRPDLITVHYPTPAADFPLLYRKLAAVGSGPGNVRGRTEASLRTRDRPRTSCDGGRLPARDMGRSDATGARGKRDLWAPQRLSAACDRRLDC